MNGDTKDRWMLARVSSGNCANVADVYHGNGTRSQRVRGLAEWCPEGCRQRWLRVWALKHGVAL